MPVPAALALAPSVMKLGLGLIQKRKANRLKKDTFIPPGMLNAEKSAKRQANATQMPGYTETVDNIAKASNTTISNARRAGGSSADVLQATAEAGARESASYQEVSKQLGDFKYANERNLQRIQQNKARFEQSNEDAYQAAKSGLKGAAIRNIHGAVSEGASFAMMSDEDIMNHPGISMNLKNMFKSGKLSKEALKSILDMGIKNQHPTTALEM